MCPTVVQIERVLTVSIVASTTTVGSTEFPRQCRPNTAQNQTLLLVFFFQKQKLPWANYNIDQTHFNCYSNPETALG